VDSVRSSDLEIQYKTPEQLVKMRAAGLVVHAALEKMRAAVVAGISTAELDAIAEDVTRAPEPYRRSRAITASRPASARR